MRSIKVNFPDHGVFWLITIHSKIREGALAPLDGCDEDGNLNGLSYISYAHLFDDGQIRQFGRIIGNRGDLIEVNND